VKGWRIVSALFDFFPRELFRTVIHDVSARTLFSFSFVDALLIALLSPLSSSFVHRALRYIVVAFTVLARLSARYPSLLLSL